MSKCPTSYTLPPKDISSNGYTYMHAWLDDYEWTRDILKTLHLIKTLWSTKLGMLKRPDPTLKSSQPNKKKEYSGGFIRFSDKVGWQISSKEVPQINFKFKNLTHQNPLSTNDKRVLKNPMYKSFVNPLALHLSSSVVPFFHFQTLDLFPSKFQTYTPHASPLWIFLF